jgi:hypothetical protein
VSAEPAAVPGAIGTSDSQTALQQKAGVRALPTALWLAAIVVLSSAVRGLLAVWVPGPGIFPDEVIYADLARGIASSGSFLIRDTPYAGWTYGPVYVLLIAPAYWLHALPDAYVAAKAIGSLAMSLAAVPAYFLARRLLDRRAALFAAALTLALPAMAYSSRLMTETVFLPVFLTAVLAFVRCLERPTHARQVMLIGAVALAALTRAQGIVLVPAFVTAAASLAWLELTEEGERTVRGFVRRLARYRILWGVTLIGAAGATAAALMRGGSPISTGSRHQIVLDHFRLLEMPKWILYHVAELDLAVGIIPFAAFLLLAGPALRRPEQRAIRSFMIASLSLAGWLVILISLYASQQPYPRTLERYLFCLEPLFLIALFGWLRLRPRVRALPVIAAAALPLALPYGSLLNYHVFAATPGLVPWLKVRELGGATAVFALLGAVSAGVAALLLSRRREQWAVLPVVVYLGYSALLVQVAYADVSTASLRAGVGGEGRAWIDRAVGSHAEVAVLWSGRGSQWSSRRVWVNEFFNRSVGPVYYLRSPMQYQLPETHVHLRGTTLELPSGKALKAEYVLSDGTRIEGRTVASSPRVHLTLYRVSGAVRLRP